MEDPEIVRETRKALDALETTQKTVVKLRYGIGGAPALSVKDCAQVLAQHLPVEVVKELAAERNVAVDAMEFTEDEIRGWEAKGLQALYQIGLG